MTDSDEAPPSLVPSPGLVLSDAAPAEGAMLSHVGVEPAAAVARPSKAAVTVQVPPPCCPLASEQYGNRCACAFGLGLQRLTIE